MTTSRLLRNVWHGLPARANTGWKPVPQGATKPVPQGHAHAHTGWKPVPQGATGWKPVPQGHGGLLQQVVRRRTCWLVPLLLGAVSAAWAEVRVQDIAHLQGQRTNKLMGYGLVVGLPGTGDGEKYLPTMRALMRLHERYHSPILSDADVKGNNKVALVTVEATIPEHGARAGEVLDVVVSAIGSAKSLQGGQLLTTPLQYVMFDEEDPATQQILALAGGQVTIPDGSTATRGLVRHGAVLEEDFFYSFIEDDYITLVLDDQHAGWTWAHMMTRAINHELATPDTPDAKPGDGPDAEQDVAVAMGPKNVAVRIPPFELGTPANFISRVLQTPLFMLPQPAARVIINRTTKNVSFTGAVTISPTVLQIPGVGTVLIGKRNDAAGPGNRIGAVEFNELLNMLSAIQVTPDQLLDAIEHLHKTGTLHAQLQYE